MFPYYLSLGCSYNEFWFESAHIAAAYREAEIYRREQENYNAWLHGLYVNCAVGSALAMAFWNRKGKKPEGYIEHPIPFTEREKEADKQRRIEATMKFIQAGQQKAKEAAAKKKQR